MTFHDDILDALDVEFVDDSAPLSAVLGFVLVMLWGSIRNV